MVVSNTSPIMNLAVVGHLGLLRDLFGQVLIPEAVERELRAIQRRRPLGLDIQASLWLTVCAVEDRGLAASLLRQLQGLVERVLRAAGE